MKAHLVLKMMVNDDDESHTVTYKRHGHTQCISNNNNSNNNEIPKYARRLSERIRDFSYEQKNCS